MNTDVQCFCSDCKFLTLIHTERGFWRLACAINKEKYITVYCILPKPLYEFYMMNYVVEKGELKFISKHDNLIGE